MYRLRLVIVKCRAHCNAEPPPPKPHTRKTAHAYTYSDTHLKGVPGNLLDVQQVVMATAETALQEQNLLIYSV